MSSNDQKKGDDMSGGSVWTSYSDLFMTLGVVFLIMFVFTALQSQVEKFRMKVEQAQEAEARNAKVPEKLKQRRQAQKESMEQTLSEIQKKNQVIQEKMAEFQKLNSDLESQKAIYKTILEDQVKHDGILAESQSTIQALKEELKQIQENSKREIAKAQAEARSSQSEIAKLQKQSQTFERERMEIQQELETRTATLQAQMEHVTKNYQTEKKRLEQSALDLKTELVQAHQNQKMVMKNLKDHFTEADESQRREIRKLQSQLAQELANAKKQFDSEKSQLMKQLAQLTDNNSQLENKLQGLSSEKSSSQQALRDAQAEANQLRNRGANLESQLGQLQANNQALNGELQSLKSTNGGLEGQMKGLQKTVSELKGQLAINEKELEAMRECNTQQTQLAKSNQSLKDKLGQARTAIRDIATRRQKIMERVLAKLNGNGVEVEADMERGIITLRMDDIFGFENNSAHLSQEAKERLKKIIPVYADALFKDTGVDGDVAGVVITGFASPRHRLQYVDPMAQDHVAYDYNLELSMRRSEAIARYIFGPEIGPYSQKDVMKKVTSAAGRSFMDPAPAQPGQRDVASEQCGPYDCRKSRRVEFTFVLKDFQDISERVQAINQEL